MADRARSYPMFPQSVTPNSLQQPQIPQQPPQSQQTDAQIISALSNPEHSRLWAQINQLQNPYRSQQASDLPQMNQASRSFFLPLRPWENPAPRLNDMSLSYPSAATICVMQEFARGQALSHGQGQTLVQLPQSFALNAQRMNPSVFHDPQTSQPQSLIPSNFANVPMNTQQQVKAPFNMNPMMHGLNNPGVSRQLKILSQQEIVRLQQSGLGPQPPPSQPPSVDMFVSSSIQPPQDQMHGSPHPSAQPIGPPGPTQGIASGNPQQKRMMTPAEFQERRTYLLNLISQSENSLASLLQSARNANSMDTLIQQKITRLRLEFAKRKEAYTKFVATYGAMVNHQMANAIPPSNMSHVNRLAPSTSQQSQQVSVSNSQSGFGPQGNQPITSQYNIPANNGPSPLPSQVQGPLNQQIPIQPPQIGRPNAIPPRTGGTPHQIPGGQHPNTMSPNLGNFATQGGQKVPNEARQSVGIMPLDKPRFNSTYAQFCRGQNMNPGPRVAIGENRMVDLHELHVQVMREGGAKLVTQRDMWAVIGGRLGFIQFPGNDAEPGQSGPGIAQQLHNTYETYLQHFENAYIMTVKNRPPGGSPQQPIHQMNSNPVPISNNGTPGMSGNSTEMPPNHPRPLFNQHVIAVAARHAHTSAQDMRAQSVQEPMIAFVERHRAELQKVYQQQLQLIVKRNAEQEQQNLANAQNRSSNLPEQMPINLQLQRPIGVNPMVNMPPGDVQMANGSFVPENVAAALQKQPPTQDQIQHAMMTINQLKSVFQQRLAGMSTSQIPDEQRLEYNQLLEQVYKMTSDLDAKLHIYFAVLRNEDFLRKYVAIILTVARQRQLLSTNSPQYIINPSTLHTMHQQIHKFNEEFEGRWRAIKASAVAANSSHLSLVRLNSATPHAVPPAQSSAQLVHHPSQTGGRTVSINPQPSQPAQPSPSQSHVPPPPLPPSHSQSLQAQAHPPTSQPIKKPFHPSIPPSPSAPLPPSTLTSPTPPPAVASSSTPATGAPTPQTAAGSPQTPKSPPSKTVAKVKTASRAHRKLSTAAGGRGPSTPETVPSVVGVKRPPEEDVATLTDVTPLEVEAINAPSPKKAKTEWEGETNGALVKRQQELENIKTDEDAAAFFDRMKELFAMTASTSNGIHHDIASTLDQILAGVAQGPADAAALTVHGAGDVGPPPTALSPHLGPANDAFLEFIDFSSFTTLEDEDNDSKAPTPDLVPSSEANPSPESGSEGDLAGSTGSPDKTKIEDRSDPLRLGSLKEIDGGESAYYQVDNWKWEGAMPTLDQPWAIFTS